jgi:AraC-like DNA-binding protein
MRRKKNYREDIRVWRNGQESGIEYRRGVAVAEPYPRHWHDEYQLCLITDGGGELQYRGFRHDTPVASLFIVHPGEVHSNNTKTGCSFRSMYIEPRVVKALGAEFSNGAHNLPFFQDTIIQDREIVSDYISVHRASEDDSPELEREFLFRRLMFKLISHQSRSAILPPNVGREPRIVNRIRDHIIENLDRNISLSELEQLTGLSTFHLNRVFSKAVGVPPHEFQTQVRVSTARKLIRSGVGLTDSAHAVGFADQSHLHRHFLRLMKVTPGEYCKASKNVQ